MLTLEKLGGLADFLSLSKHEGSVILNPHRPLFNLRGTRKKQ